MANANEFTIAPETAAWLTIRQTFRYEQQAAYLGKVMPDTELPTPANPTAGAAGNQQSTDYACEVIHNGYFTLVNPGVYQTNQATYGWPPANELIKGLLDSLASTDARPSYDEIIRKQLQVNTLESFRRTLLHQRQRRKHLLRHQQQTFLAEKQAQTELQALLQNTKVGQTATPTPAS